METNGSKRLITRNCILKKLYGILSMVDGFDSKHVGGNRQKDLVRLLPHQIASEIMELQKTIETSVLEGDVFMKN